MRLVYKGTDKEVKVGDIVTDFRGEDSIVSYFAEPNKPSSEGKITVKRTEDDFGREYYVSCFGLEWIEREDRQ